MLGHHKALRQRYRALLLKVIRLHRLRKYILHLLLGHLGHVYFESLRQPKCLNLKVFALGDEVVELFDVSDGEFASHLPHALLVFILASREVSLVCDDDLKSRPESEYIIRPVLQGLFQLGYFLLKERNLILNVHFCQVVAKFDFFARRFVFFGAMRHLIRENFCRHFWLDLS